MEHWVNGHYQQVEPGEYIVAFVNEAGQYDMVDVITAESDAATNEQAEEDHPEEEWYVLDHLGNNING